MAYQLGRVTCHRDLAPAPNVTLTSPSLLTQGLRVPARQPSRRRHATFTNVRATAVTAEAGATLTPEQKDDTRNKQKNDLKATADREMKAVLQRVSEAGQSSPPEQATGAIAPLKTRLQHAIENMQEGLVERDTEVRLLLLAALAQEHILYIGPPGTAKSELGRRLSRLCKGTFFERLLTRFSVPEELFGPLSMRALEDDKYVRQTEGYLPKANVAFIDEIFKANSAILNTLLTVLNERLFDNGTVRERVPLLCMVGASNELPESEELDALYDRFLIRRQVSPVSNFGLNAMLQAAADNNLAGTSLHTQLDDAAEAGQQSSTALSFQECQEVRQQAVRQVSVPAEVRQLLADLRSHLAEKVEPPVYISDRRLVKSVALMQVAAYTSGKDSVSLLDCLLLQHILWQQPDQQARITDFLLSQISEDDGLKSANYILASIFSRACTALCGQKGNRESVLAEATALKESLVDKLASLRSSQGGNARSSGIGGNMWISEQESKIVASTLFPKMNKTKKEHEDLLYEAVTLEVALGSQVDPVVLADRMPSRWSDFVRNAPMDEVRPLATQKKSSFRSQANLFSSRPNLVNDPSQTLADIDRQLDNLRKGRVE